MKPKIENTFLVISGATEANRQVSWSPKKRLVKSPPRKRIRKGAWSYAELCSLVEYVALHKDTQSAESEWPAMNADNNYWTDASKFIMMSCGTSRGSKYQIMNQIKLLGM